jgi:hypothetical protein
MGWRHQMSDQPMAPYFEAWTGDRWSETQTLLLGESAYGWIENDKLYQPRPSHCKESVPWWIENFYNHEYRFPFGRCLSRAVANSKRPTHQQMSDAWAQFAFINYVPISVGDGRVTKRPSKEHWRLAKDIFRTRILNTLQSHRIIVIGLTMWQEMPDVDVQSRNPSCAAYRLSNGMLCWCYAVRHPRARLSWRELASTIHSAGRPFDE